MMNQYNFKNMMDSKQASTSITDLAWNAFFMQKATMKRKTTKKDEIELLNMVIKMAEEAKNHLENI